MTKKEFLPNADLLDDFMKNFAPSMVDQVRGEYTSLMGLVAMDCSNKEINLKSVL